MSRFECSYQSKALLSPSTVQVILPYPSTTDQASIPLEELYRLDAKFKTMYLFHGAFSDGSMWLNLFNVEYYSEKYRLAMVMPSVGNSFYANLLHGPAYWTFVSEELPRYLQAVFPLSSSPEDNFVAGISMGGYGALKMALNKPDQFAAGICLSGALDIVSIMKNPIHPIFNVDEFFGGFERLVGSNNDLYALLPKLASQGVHLPALYMACGVDDDLYEMSRKFQDLARDYSITLTFEEGPGSHNCDFWEIYFRRSLDWLELNCLRAGTSPI